MKTYAGSLSLPLTIILLAIVACSSDADSGPPDLPNPEPLTAENEQALLKEYGQIALHNQQSSDQATRDMIDQIIVARVTLLAETRGLVAGSPEFLSIAQSETGLIWALYAHAPPEALKAFLMYSRYGYRYVSDDFRTLADRNRKVSSEARAQTIDQLINCQTIITQQLAPDADLELDAIADRFWAMLGSTVPERDIEVHTTLTCNRLA